MKLRNQDTGVITNVDPELLPVVKPIRTGLSGVDTALLATFTRIAEPGSDVAFVKLPKRLKTGYSAEVVCTKPTFAPALFSARLDERSGKIKLRKKTEVRIKEQ